MVMKITIYHIDCETAVSCTSRRLLLKQMLKLTPINHHPYQIVAV